MFTCDTCSKEFKRRDNMLRHKNTMHNEEESVAVTDNESDEGSSSGSAFEEEDDGSWNLLVSEAFEQCQPEFEERFEKYAQGGGDQADAREHVYEQMKDRYRKAMMNSFVNKMLWFNKLRKEPVYTTIKKTVSDLKMDEDFDEEEAWKAATGKRKYLFDRILKMYEAPELEEDESMEEDERMDTEVTQGGGGGGHLQTWERKPVASADQKLAITVVSPAQQVVEMAKSELERKNRKRAASPMDRDTKIHIIG